MPNMESKQVIECELVCRYGDGDNQIWVLYNRSGVPLSGESEDNILEVETQVSDMYTSIIDRWYAEYVFKITFRFEPLPTHVDIR